MSKNKSILFHPGVYKFKWPYIAWTMIRDENGEIETYYCNVKVIVGDEIDLQAGRLVTVVVYPLKDSIGTTNYFEAIASGLRNYMIRTMFLEYYKEEDPIEDKAIRWIEIYDEDYTQGSIPEECREIKMKWDKKLKCYTGFEFELIEFEKRYEF